MIDLHTHTIWSDGVLVPAELARRAETTGYCCLAFTDHADASNLEILVPRLAEVCRQLNRRWSIRLLPGVELTHNPPEDIPRLAGRARELGAVLVVVHGETIVEPVPPGTNRSAIEAGVDILAHPGLLTDDDCRLAAERGVLLEITTRKGHCYTNGHVAAMARKHGARLVINTDSHEPGDLVTVEKASRIAMGAGLSHDEVLSILADTRLLADTFIKRLE